jgi:hypothetical protein
VEIYLGDVSGGEKENEVLENEEKARRKVFQKVRRYSAQDVVKYFVEIAETYYTENMTKLLYLPYPYVLAVFSLGLAFVQMPIFEVLLQG